MRQSTPQPPAASTRLALPELRGRCCATGQRVPAVRADSATYIEDSMMRIVVCAAIRSANGKLLLGIRHYSADMHEQIRLRHDGDEFRHRRGEDQGFVDQNGVWMDRHEAYYVATEAGQIRRGEACGHDKDGPLLYSEALY